MTNKKEVKSKVEKVIKDAVKNMVLKNPTHISSDTIEELTSSLGNEIGEFLAVQRDNLYEARDSVEETIKEKPFITTSTCFLAGLLVGVLLKRF